MKAAESKIDFVNDRVNIFGKDIHLNLTTSGHYAIPRINILVVSNKKQRII